MTIHTDQEEVKTRRLNVTIACQAVYSSSIDVPADLSLEDALKYAKEHISEIPLTSLEYIPDILAVRSISKKPFWRNTDLTVWNSGRRPGMPRTPIRENLL